MRCEQILQTFLLYRWAVYVFGVAWTNELHVNIPSIPALSGECTVWCISAAHTQCLCKRWGMGLMGKKQTAALIK
uniref:Putative secreted protein n=1 Tax=Anopheles triannulatus TaxID=58253 RepID=A0A2M4B5S9_9DIPT